jgi:hypothetical protein
MKARIAANWVFPDLLKKKTTQNNYHLLARLHIGKRTVSSDTAVHCGWCWADIVLSRPKGTSGYGLLQLLSCQ